MLDLIYLIFVVEYFIRGLIFLFGGFCVIVLKNEDNLLVLYMVVMSCINYDEFYVVVSEGCGFVFDFWIKVFWVENLIDVDGFEMIIFKNVNFVSNLNSLFCKEMLMVIVNNIEDFVKVYGMEIKVNYLIVFIFILYSVNYKIGVVFDILNICKCEDNKLE